MINVNSFPLSYYGKVNQIKRNILPPSELTTVDIPARPGLLLLMKKHGARQIVVDMTLKAKNGKDLTQLAEDFSVAIDSEDVVPITFDDEPSRVYYGILMDEIDKDDVVHNIGQITFTLLCPDPYKYGPEFSLAVPSSGLVTVSNRGTVKTYPKLKFTVNSPVTFLSCVSPDGYVLLGNPNSVEQTPAPKKERLLNDSLTTTVGWTSGSTVVDGGEVSGTMISSNGQFVASSYGTGSAWHGPALKKSLPTPIQDFTVEFWVQFDSSVPELGRLELYLLDTNNAVIGKLALKDDLVGAEHTHFEARAGAQGTGKYIISQAGAQGNAKIWNNFAGLLRLTRIGNKWEAEIVANDSKGNPYGVLKKTFIDTGNRYSAPLAQVNIHAGARGTYTPARKMAVSTLRVYRHNQIQETQSPFIADVGDVVTVDCGSGIILMNDVPAQELYNPATQFISLSPGSTELAFLPNDKVTGEVTLSERWK